MDISISSDFFHNPSILDWKKTYPHFGSGSKYTKIIDLIYDLEKFDERVGNYRLIGNCARYLADIIFIRPENLNGQKLDINLLVPKRRVLFEGSIEIFDGAQISGIGRHIHRCLLKADILDSRPNTSNFILEDGLRNFLLGTSKNPEKKIEKIIRSYNNKRQNQEISAFNLMYGFS